MAFEKKVWIGGDTVTAAHLNRIENGIEEAMNSGATVELAPPDWNENDPESPAYIQNRPFYETTSSVTLYEGTLTLAAQGRYAQATDSTSIASDTLYDGMPITITVDGVSEEQILTSMNYGTVAYFCGDPSTTRFSVYVDPAQSIVQIIDYQNSTERSANVSVVSSQNTLVKIPAKYLPDDVVIAGEGVGSTIQGLFGNAGEGTNNTATGDYAHVEGGGTSTNASTGVTTYHKNTASGDASHAEGQDTTASGVHSHAEGGGTTASAPQAHAEGAGTTASGVASHAEGGITTASGSSSHAEGHQTTASGYQSHAEGSLTVASGSNSHAEGCGGTFTIDNVAYESGATGTATHAEGYQTLASTTAQPGTHSEGYQTRATGGAAHAEGDVTNASGIASHAEGTHTNASGVYAHAEGFYTNASGVYSHAEGNHTTASGSDSSHAEGSNTTASGNFSHAEGSGTIANHASQHVFGENNVADPSTALAIARGTYVEIVGNGTSSSAKSNARTLDWNGNEWLAGKLTVGVAPTADMDVATKKYVDDNTGGAAVVIAGTGVGSTVQGVFGNEDATNNNQATANYAHVEGGYAYADPDTGYMFYFTNTASGIGSHAEGRLTTASGQDSHAEGNDTTASNKYSHAEGESTTASGHASHAEGSAATASGVSAHAEGDYTTASGNYSHAEGSSATASGDYSHAEGCCTIANHAYQHVFGHSNIADPSTNDPEERGTYIEIVGNGEDIDTRSNARTLDWNGNETLAGSLTLGKGTADEVTVTAAQLKALIAMLST